MVEVNNSGEFFETDLHYLGAFDGRPVPIDRSEISRRDYKTLPDIEQNDGMEAELKRLATENTNFIVQSLFSLAKSQGNVSKCDLPEAKTSLPRYKPLPQPKAETKWEKFAKEKGIKKRKRERMVWSDELKKYVPRHGYNPDEKQQDWVQELDEKDDLTQDKFLANRKKKKLNVLRNRSNQLKNMKAAEKKMGKEETPTGYFGIGVETDVKGRKAMKGKKGTKLALQQAQISTASLGKFDRKQKTEPDVKENKRQKREDNLNFSNAAMQKRDQRILTSVLKSA